MKNVLMAVLIVWLNIPTKVAGEVRSGALPGLKSGDFCGGIKIAHGRATIEAMEDVGQSKHSKIIFNTKKGIMSINQDGLECSTLLEGHFYGANTYRNGEKLVCLGGANYDETYIAGRDGSNIYKLAIPAMMHVRWSWDGSKLAGTLIDAQLAPNGSKIAVFNPEGKDLRVLAEGHHPCWTRDNRIVFATKNDICILDTDNNNQQVVISNLDRPDTTDCSEENQILFNAYVAPGRWSDMKIFKVGLDGRGLEQLTNASFVRDVSAHYNSEGKKIVFERYILSDQGDIWIMDASGENQQNIRANNDVWKEMTFYSF